jgi:hypothetical protein
MTRRTQDAWAVGLGEGVGEGVGEGGAAVEVGLGVRCAVGDGVALAVPEGADGVVVIGGPAQPAMTTTAIRAASPFRVVRPPRQRAFMRPFCSREQNGRNIGPQPDVG